MVTRKDVALKAGVSPSTVSRVINNNGYVAMEVRKRIEAAIAELNYIPNRAAQNLRMKSYKQIACISPSINNSFFAEMFMGIEEMAIEVGYSLSLYNITKKKPDFLKQVVEGPYDGLILLASHELIMIKDILENIKKMPLSIYWDRIDKLNIPLKAEIPHVYVDLKKVMRQSVNHLITNGHKEILFLGHYYQKEKSSNPRYKGYEMAMKEHNLEIKEYYRIFVEMYEDKLTTGYEAIKMLLDKGQYFTAVAASNDLLAAGAIRAIIESGKKVPEDISVIGVDNIELAKIVTPTLTTMNIPKREIGKMLVQQLMDQIQNENTIEKSIEVEVMLKERESVKKLMI
ncbi:LacI family transcriptional regulator [Neobacillus sp. MER 74]|uniref:LacI family DNA-binding transcriptional regulator n=1 Tax=Bacillaceae TaxID=186817 RepID=UPI000BF9EE94|nr:MULTISPECIES: LacI family DNA-binding transcriptional regulator [Bacillaceae]MCM3118673.1 LacI family transcriptional regulator [Neobacillus sp. MER 74]PFP29609.1 LacI family transcriptional regulator [Bacillus sp. AFS073361]